MGQVWELLEHRAGHKELPADIGPDPDSEEPEPPDPPAAVLHLVDADFQKAADTLRVELAVIRAVIEVESAGRGFLDEDPPRPTVLYEAHVFSRLTGHRYLGRKDRRGVALASRRWDRSLYGRAGAAQWDRINDAAALDWNAAHMAASYGYFQILGENARQVGFSGHGENAVRSFVEAMHTGAAAHLAAFIGYIRSRRLEGALRARDWARFARAYNGPGYASHRPPYDIRLANAFAKWSRSNV